MAGQDLRGARIEHAYLTDARFHDVDLTGARFNLVDLTGVSIRGAAVVNVDISGEIDNVRVNGVDVVPLVEAELNRRYPDRPKMRPTTAGGYRDAWDVVERLWGETVERARALPPEMLHQRVDDEWSFIETQRHLLHASDKWLGNPVLEEDEPYHPLGFGPGGDPDGVPGITVDADPSLEEILTPRLARMATMRTFVAGVTDADLDRLCTRKPIGNDPDADYTVRRCLKVVLAEEAEHHRYAVRDLAAITAGRG